MFVWCADGVCLTRFAEADAQSGRQRAAAERRAHRQTALPAPADDPRRGAAPAAPSDPVGQTVSAHSPDSLRRRCLPPSLSLSLLISGVRARVRAWCVLPVMAHTTLTRILQRRCRGVGSSRLHRRKAAQPAPAAADRGPRLFPVRVGQRRHFYSSFNTLSHISIYINIS